VRAAEPLLEHAGARGTGGLALMDTFDRFNRSLADARRYVSSSKTSATRRFA